MSDMVAIQSHPQFNVCKIIEIFLLHLAKPVLNMGLDFYYLPGSAPCRAVMLTAKALGINLNLKHCDLMKGEHLTPEFLKVSFS